MTESTPIENRTDAAVENRMVPATEGTRSTDITPLPRSIGHLCRAIEKLDSGDLADLRRHPATSLAFHRLHAYHFPEVRREKTEERWQVLVQAIAILNDLYDPTTNLGTALARAKLSEGRLTRLLRADPSALPTQIHACARILAAKAERQNMWGFSQLLGIRVAESKHETVRRRIAADYFRALSEKQRATPKE